MDHFEMFASSKSSAAKQAAVDTHAHGTPAGQNGSERRQFERRVLHVPAQLHLNAGGNTTARPMSVRTVDISLGGMAVVAPVNLREGVLLEIHFTMVLRRQPSVDLKLKVEVMHSILARDVDGFKVGLRFVALDDWASQAIHHFVV